MLNPGSKTIYQISILEIPNLSNHRLTISKNLDSNLNLQTLLKDPEQLSSIYNPFRIKLHSQKEKKRKTLDTI